MRSWQLTCFMLIVYTLKTITADVSAVTDLSLRRRIKKRDGDVGAKLQRDLVIATIVHEPYTMVTRNSQGKDEYTGFIPDLVYILSRRLRFNYQFYLSSAYGSYNSTSATWSGLIGDVVKNQKDPTQGADMAAATITITRRREAAVDFIKPFQHMGLSVIMKRILPVLDPATQPYGFRIFQPLTAAVWGLVILSAIVVGLFLWLVNMYNPYEWAARHTIGEASKDEADSFNLVNSMWFVFTTLQWQGYERSPRSISGRFLAAIWFVFVTILLVTYTAGVVNLLFWATTVQRSGSAQSRPRSLEDLVSSGQYKIGTVLGGQTYHHLKNVAVGEEFDTIRRSWDTKDGAKNLVSTVPEGLKKVRDDEKFALIIDSMTAQYEIHKLPCDLAIVGETFALRSYGFALPNNSLILEEMHTGILELSEEGEIEALEERWFREGNQCWNMSLVDNVFTDINFALYVDKPKSVDMHIFWGPFVLLIVGAAISIIIALAEVFYYRQWGRFQSRNQPPHRRHLHLDPDDGNI